MDYERHCHGHGDDGLLLSLVKKHALCIVFLVAVEMKAAKVNIIDSRGTLITTDHPIHTLYTGRTVRVKNVIPFFDKTDSHVQMHHLLSVLLLLSLSNCILYQ